jgi:Right handed beta helix region
VPRVISVTRTLWLVAAGVLVSTGCVLSAQNPPTVVVRPGQNIQELVENSPEGTRLLFDPGIYRQQTIRPKNRQQFIGQDGVILNGAMELKSWTNEAGLWRHEGLPDPLRFHGKCADGGELCQFREDLFVNDRLYRRVASVDDLAPGNWYYESPSAYLADDPTGQSVELGVTPLAFGSQAEDVLLENLVVEKYASDAQRGAIFLDRARGWLISNVTARWNHGAGLSFGSETHIEGGSFSHNGQLGISGSRGQGSRIDGVEIAFNNYAGYDAGWEAGGTKFGATTGLIVRNSCVHHNAGPGLWTDYDNIGTIYEGNMVFMNGKEGIKHEISYDAIIRDNIVAANGRRKDNWLWGSQILIQNSSNVEVHRNLVEVSAEFGNGITIIHQGRGEGAHGPWDAVRNLVHDNTIIHLGGRGRNGVVTDEDDSYWTEAANRFDRNSYIVPDGAVRYWTARDRNARWDDVEELGFEQNGALIVETRAPIELSCAR